MKHIFERLRAGEIIRLNEPDFSEVNAVVNKTLALTPLLNNAKDINEIRSILSEITGSTIDQVPPCLLHFM